MKQMRSWMGFQDANWCAIDARWQNARVTSRAVQSPDRTFVRILWFGELVISSSLAFMKQ